MNSLNSPGRENIFQIPLKENVAFVIVGGDQVVEKKTAL